jgi:Holliday junction resolvasome RuvABC endonuclease subunit
MDVEGLRTKLREQKETRSLPTKKSLKGGWRPLEVDDFADGVVLAFDQTLTKTGWAVIWKWDGKFKIDDGGLIQPTIPLDLKGFEQTFAKAEHLGEGIGNVIKYHFSYVDGVVHEMPSVQGNRIESSLMAAREIRRELAKEQARRCGDTRIHLAMYGRQQAYSVITGNPHSPKKRMSEEVNRLFPSDMRSTTHWNQDVHDAVGLALLDLYLKKKANDG